QSLSALRVGEVDPHPGGGPLLRRHAAKGAFLARLHQGRNDCWRSDAHGSCPTRSGYMFDLPADRRHGALSWGASAEAGSNCVAISRVDAPYRMAPSYALPTRAPDQLHES